MMKQVLLTSSLLVLGGLTTGCASTAKGLKSSVVNQSVPTESLRADIPEGGVLAVIRYPAIVEADAKDTFHRAYAKYAIGGAPGRGVTNTIETVAVADSAVIKSNYFALSLYKELAAKLPEHGVLLSPHAIKLGAGGELTLVTVRTDHRASVPNHGVLLASQPLASRAAAEGRENALETIEALQRGDLEPVTPELDFISYITNDTPQNLSTQSLEVRSDKNATMILPVEKIRIPKSEMFLLEGASDGTVDPIDDIYTDALASRIVALINGLDADKAVMMGRAANIAEFDPSLAALTFVGSDEDDYAARIAYAERLLEAQRKYLSVQSLRIFDGIHNGELGAQVRDMIAAEQQILEARRTLARQQNLSTLLAVASVVGGVAATSGSSSSESERRQRTAAGSILTQAAIFAATEAYSKAQLSKQVGINYLNSIVPALDQQTTVTLDLLDSNETITAIRYEDLQAKLQDLYSERQRSLETVATQCAYLEAGGAKRGTWLGVCENGLANGSGAGVLKTGDEVLEYYGYAKDGYAHGPGLMIKHSSIGSLSYEGSFAQGRPDGVVRVSQSGKSDKTRNFAAGIDQGASTQSAVSPFDGLIGRAVN